MDHVALFGIGSTHFRYTAATADGEFLTDITVEPTRPHALPAQLVSALDDLAAATTAALDAVGVACPGLVDPAAGVIRDLDTPDGETLARVDLATPVSEAYDLPVFLANDCTASALGEWYYGARTDENCLAHVTFGTGIGGGVVERGRPVRGEAGQAGEFGLLPVAPDSDLASTGVTGAWEAVCSGRGIPAYVTHRAATTDVPHPGGDGDTPSWAADSGSLTAKDVFDAAAAGDAFAQDCLETVARYNAAGIAAICNAVNPGLITLGGGVALHNPDWILEGIEASLDDYLFVDRPAIQLTPLGDDIGLYGALATTHTDVDGSPPAATPRPASGETD